MIVAKALKEFPRRMRIVIPEFNNRSHKNADWSIGPPLSRMLPYPSAPQLQEKSDQSSEGRLFFQTAPQIFHILLQDKKDEDGKPPLAKGSSFRKPGPLSSVCRSSKSISFAHFPYSWKLAVVRHILKAGSNKYHPISLLILSDSARINSDVVQHYQLETISW